MSAVLKLLLAAALLQVGSARAQATADELQGTLKKAQASGTVALAYRRASIPFSYVGPGEQPIGYSIDICRAIVDAMSDQLGKTLAIRWVPVTSDTRLPAIINGDADLECGSTTNNVDRRKQVAFSPIIFVAGTKLMVAAGSPIRSFRDLGGKTVAVTAGTTNEAAMRELIAKFKLDTKIVVGRDHAESYAMLGAAQADAFATDDVLLAGLIAENHAQATRQVVGEFLSYEPYGIVFRRGDPQLAALVRATVEGLARSRELEYTYNHWFLRSLPSGERVNLPMSPQLTEILRSMGEEQ